MSIFAYLCIVKLTSKNMVLSFVLLMGILLNYNIYYQYSTIPENIELTSENTSSNNISSDSEINIEEPISNKIEIVSSLGINKQDTHFKMTGLPFSTCFSVWQPPKVY